MNHAIPQRLASQSENIGFARLAGFFGVLVGAALIVTLVVTIQVVADRVGRNDDARSRIIEVVRQKQQRTEVVKPVEQAKPPPSKPRAPMPQLDSLLAGVDLGIKEFVVADVSASTRELLGDVSRSGIMSESSVDSKPRVIHRTPLVFPRNAVKKKINGYVLLSVLINEAGDVEAAKVLDSEPEGVFETAALRGVQTWRFAPARYQGKPVRIWARQRVRFDARQ